jgi:hypothetical protein
LSVIRLLKEKKQLFFLFGRMNKLSFLKIKKSIKGKKARHPKVTIGNNINKKMENRYNSMINYNNHEYSSLNANNRLLSGLIYMVLHPKLKE